MDVGKMGLAMLTKRIIPCLDIRNGKVTKGVKFQNNVVLGDPVENLCKALQDNDGWHKFSTFSQMQNHPLSHIEVFLPLRACYG